LSLVAADLMSPADVTIPEEMSLQGAAHRLAQADVSGAPVVDPEGCCVGVLSAHDFVTWAGRGDRPARNRAECYCSAWQLSPGDDLPDDTVRNFMTSDPVTVTPSTSIGVLARMMVDAHIHRVIVLDK